MIRVHDPPCGSVLVRGGVAAMGKASFIVTGSWSRHAAGYAAEVGLEPSLAILYHTRGDLWQNDS